MGSRTYTLKMASVTPLLMHNDDIAWSEKIQKWQKDPANKDLSHRGDDRSPAWVWYGYCYFNDGVICLPSDNMMTMFRSAGAQLILKGSKTYKEPTQSQIVINELGWPLLVNGKPIQQETLKALIGENDFSKHIDLAESLGFQLFCKRAKIGQQKHIRVRPRFDSWECTGRLTVLDDELINIDILKKILDIASNRVGLCDWRPSSPRSPGSFGKFSYELQ